MSYAKPKPLNPATKFIEFKGDTGVFQYYVKPENEGEKGENIEISLPIRFIVIDELSTISGYNKKNECGIYSNEIHSLKEILSVRCFKGQDGYIGTYAEIKDAVKVMGGKFAKSIYALIIIDGKTELVNFKIKGAFLNAWIESKIDIDKQGIFIEACNKKKSGKNDYYEPIVKSFTPPEPEKTLKVAQSYYKLLKEYFDKKKQFVEEQQAVTEEIKEPDTAMFDGEGNLKEDDLPF